MQSLLLSLFSHKDSGRPKRGCRRVQRSLTHRHVEQLEQRLALTINVFSPVAGTSFAPWFVITSDNADDVYVQQVATVPQDLLIADNPSFNNAKNLGAFHAEGALWGGINVYTSAYVTNGTAVSVSNVLATDASDGSVSRFTLATKVADKDTTNVGVIGNVDGQVTYLGNTWRFSNDPQFLNSGFGNTLYFTLLTSGSTSDPALIRPVSGQIFIAEGGTSGVRIQWSGPAVPAAGQPGPIISTVKYDITTAAPPGVPKTYTEGGLNASYGSKPFLQLPVTQRNPGGIVPGTLSGTLTIDGSAVDFRISTLFPPVNKANALAFANGTGTPPTIGAFTINANTPYEKTIDVTAAVDYDSGVVSLTCKAGGNPIDPGAVSLSANYAVYNQDAIANTFTFAPGLTFEKELYVDLLTPGSGVDVNNPLIQNKASGYGELSLRATNINLNAQVMAQSYLDIGGSLVDRNARVIRARGFAVVAAGAISAIGVPAGAGGQGYDDTNPSTVTITGGGGSGATALAYSTNGVITSIVVTNGGSGYTSLPTVSIPLPPFLDANSNPRFPALATALAEQVNFNAAVAAPQFDIRVADDPSTAVVDRGLVFVSSTGSLSATLAAGSAPSSAGSLYMQADTSDIYVEGTISADTQSYLFRSPSGAQALAPFQFTTRSLRSGANTGLIRGTTVAVTLGNDLPTPEQGSVATNIVDLQTKIASLRVRAATQKGAPLNGPFPYDLTINELDDISIDAVAASSKTISLSAAGSMAFTAALATAGDLLLRAGSDFTVSAPVSTSRGSIAVTAANVTVNNSLRVLDPASDEYKNDIVLTALAGSLNLTGAVTAVNNVRLVQQNKTGTSGKVSGPSRIIARGLDVAAQGSADLRTDVDTLTASAAGDFALDELNDVAITLRAPGLVTLRAGGFDPGANNPGTPNTIALSAQLVDVVALQASAPRGSVNVTTNTAKTLTLGNFAAIGNATAASLQAAGSATIRSLAGPIVVADAPIGGGSAMPVRVATTQNLGAQFAYNTPGIFASTLTNNGAKAALSIDGVALRAGDRVLVRNQTNANANENGVYVVTTVGSVSTNWKLTRATDADTSPELPVGSFIQVAEGSTWGGTVHQVGYQAVVNSSPISVTLVANRAEAIRTRVATTAMMPGTYNAAATTITAASNGSLPLIDGATLAVGDLVLVRLGAASGGAAANGVYAVSDVGGVGTPWVLTRALDPDTGSVITTGTVATTEGSYRAAVTGQAFLLAYDSLGNDPLTATKVTPVTNIGSDNLSSTATFVVASTAGANDAAGSLGKMIRLRQANDTSSSANSGQLTDFRFASVLPSLGGAPAGVIWLGQELPAITKPFAIDGASRYAVPGAVGTTARIVVDGSRISSNRVGQPAASATEITGFEFASGSGASGSAAGGSLANLTAGGFAKGAAVKVNKASGILVNNVIFGRNETGDRLSNQFGVLATGTGASATILGSTIVCSTTAGVRVGGSATGVSIVGSTIGATNQNNAIGIEIQSDVSQNTPSRIGVNPVAPGTYRAATTLGSSEMTRPTGIDSSTVFLGQSVTGAGIQAGTVITAINSSTLTLSKKMTAAGVATLSFGQPARNAIQYNLNGIVLNGGTNTVTNTNVNNNTFDGIFISGGTQTIGTSATRGAMSNAFFANGRWGVNMTSSSTPANQKIRGTYFGSPVLATSGTANVAGNVAVDGSLAPEQLGFNPTIGNAVIVVDKWGNQYARRTFVAAAGGGSGATPGNQPWRPR